MTFDEIKETEWFKERPQVIQDLIEQFPPAALVRIKATNQYARIATWFEDGTMSVGVLKKDNPEWKCTVFDHSYTVFGLSPEKLEFLEVTPGMIFTENDDGDLEYCEAMEAGE